MDDLMLPPLPLSASEYGLQTTLSFSANDMREYAKKAVEADNALLLQALAALEIYGAKAPNVNDTISALRSRLTLD